LLQGTALRHDLEMARPLAVVGERPPATPLEQLAADYLASCRARGLARTSVEQYRFSLSEVFLPWCRGQAITEVGELSQRTLDRFTSHLLEEGGRRGRLSRNTTHTYIRHVRQLLNWAIKEGETQSAAKPQLPKLPRRVLDVLSREEIDQLEGAGQTERDKLIVRLLADTGIRVGELCALRVGDVTRHERGALLRVQGKGSKERLVPLRPELARRLDRFTRHRPPDTASERIFLSLRRGPSGEYAALTTSGVGQLLSALADRAGLKKRVHPHLLRHSFATEALRRGMNPVQLAQILGHSGLRMIEAVYSHLSVSDAYDAMLRMLAAERQ
jgi:integrase/recombinase XerD